MNRLSTLLALTTLFAGLISPVEAQTTTEAVSRGLLQVYKSTQSARTEADVTAIARACSRVIQDRNRSQTDRDYASNLFGWALNRRGEMRNEAAGQLVQEGKFKEAAEMDAKAAEDYATAIQYGKPNWRVHHNYAISLAMASDFENAIEQFTRAIELNSEYANAYFNRGEIYFEAGKFADATSDYTQAIELDDSDPQYFNSRGHSRFMDKQYESAITDYKTAASLDPRSVVFKTDLADAYHYVGRWERAAETYKAAIAIDNSHARAYQNAAWLMATCPDAKFRKPELALSAARRALSLAKQKDARILDTLAAASAANGKFDEAAKILSEAIQLASSGEREELSQRLGLYRRGRAYVQPEVAMAQSTTAVRTASAQRPANESPNRRSRR